MKNYTHFIDYNIYQGKFHETCTFKTCDLITAYAYITINQNVL